MSLNLDLVLGMILAAAFLGGLIAQRVKFPKVTGYLMIGMILAPSQLGIIPAELLEQISTAVTPIALGIIAYAVGGTLRLQSLRGLLKTIALVSGSEVVAVWTAVTFLMVVVAPYVVGDALPDADPQSFLVMGIVAGAICMATAPVVTAAVAREFEAKGPLTSTLFGVVAVDNSLAIVAYALGVGVVTAMTSAQGELSMLTGIGLALAQIAASWALGAVFALVVARFGRLMKRRRELSVIVLGGIILCDGLAQFLGLSGLLACLSLGFVVTNLKPFNDELIDVVRDFEEVIFALFLALVGTHFNLKLLTSAGPLALLIVLGRCGGKISAAIVGTTLSGAPSSVRRYLGFTLLAKAGLTVGLVMLLERDLGLHGHVIPLLINAILTSTIINELVAPPLVKYALNKAGEISDEPVAQAMADFDPLRAVTVGEAMICDHPHVSEYMSLQELVNLCEHSPEHGFPVTDADGKLVGIVTLTDVQEVSLHDGTNLTVADIATKQVRTAFPDQTLRQALGQLGALDVGRLPVVDRADRQRLLGVLRRRDIVRACGQALEHRADMHRQVALRQLETGREVRVIRGHIRPDSVLAGRAVKDINIPRDCILAHIHRGDQTILPHGDTVLQPGDEVWAVCTVNSESNVVSAFASIR